MRVTPRERWDSLEQYIEYLRHFSAYMHAAKYLSGKRVLEIGCGTGYGITYLSEITSNPTVASDINKEVLHFIKKKYSFRKFFLIACDGKILPFRENQFDAVISFQVIEHLIPRDVINYLSEIKRVLTKNGLFICTTPNKRLRPLPCLLYTSPSPRD